MGEGTLEACPSFGLILGDCSVETVEWHFMASRQWARGALGWSCNLPGPTSRLMVLLACTCIVPRGRLSRTIVQWLSLCMGSLLCLVVVGTSSGRRKQEELEPAPPELIIIIIIPLSSPPVALGLFLLLPFPLTHSVPLVVYFWRGKKEGTCFASSSFFFFPLPTSVLAWPELGVLALHSATSKVGSQLVALGKRFCSGLPSTVTHTHRS